SSIAMGMVGSSANGWNHPIPLPPGEIRAEPPPSSDETRRVIESAEVSSPLGLNPNWNRSENHTDHDGKSMARGDPALSFSPWVRTLLKLTTTSPKRVGPVWVSNP